MSINEARSSLKSRTPRVASMGRLSLAPSAQINRNHTEIFGEIQHHLLPEESGGDVAMNKNYGAFWGCFRLVARTFK